MKNNPAWQPSGNGDGNSIDDAAFERALASAMKARPEPLAPSNLAARAMQMARAQSRRLAEQQTRRIARQRWWAQLSGIAATMLIVAMLAGAARKMWTRGDIAAIAAASSTDSTSATATETDAATADAATSDSSTSNYSVGNTVAIVFVGELLLLGLVLLTLPRSGPSMPWGAEAGAGMW